MKDFESLAVISDEYYCKVNYAWLTCLKIINQKGIKCNQLHYLKKVIEIVTLLITF